jgi:hypothetical protein
MIYLIRYYAITVYGYYIYIIQLFVKNKIDIK